ncbi:MAG: PQQ-binding-like beta-propeller repeat protein [Candidatus Hydrogenedentota bacterium]|nr:MAG: PQQ-binding-like beta-propeller repeat protein [Candidatus Hydrogenedentota bacterium]
MKTNGYDLARAACILMALCVISSGAIQAGDYENEAKQILDASGVKGGLVVHVGCGDGKLTTALRVNDRYLVHGLDTDAASIAGMREHLQSRGLYGPVSADRFDGRHLPYVEDIVNLLVVTDPGEVTRDEVHRVLSPGGIAYLRHGDTWHKIVEPRPEDIDEWSHFLHDASGNAVANDSQVGPPKRLRWVAGPRWCRSHEMPSSVNAVVAAGGRVFTIFDEGITGIYQKLPSRCNLVARDAANGVLLWKVPMQDWQPEFGTGVGNRWNIHHTIPRRLIAEGDRVYVTLRFLDSPVSVLDAATGEILAGALEGTKGTDEMILSDGILIVKVTKGRSVAATARMSKNSLNDTIAAIDVRMGKQLWRKENIRVMPYVLCAQAGRVVYHNLEELVCLDTKTGNEKWRVPHTIGSTLGAVSTLVINEGVVLFNGHGPPTDIQEKGKKSKRAFYLTAFSLEDGQVLWKHKGNRGQAGACTQPTDLFVVDGIVWSGGSLEGRDLRTGEVKQRLSIGKLISPGHHYRCHRSKATERFLIWPKRGAEFLDLEGDNHMRHDWLRAPCFTGATPANGLFYAPSSQCFCYPGAKVSGFLALSAEPADELKPATESNLHRGDAYGKVSSHGGASPEDWPMYRYNGRRSGSTKTPVPVELSKRWEVELVCRATQPVIVGNRLWVAEKDAHRIRCLSATEGDDIWSFTAGGRIDSAPTIYNGLVLFGCRDGWVYCLRATDGALVWRFRAAPDRRVMSYGQLESLWPIQGSVLVQNGIVYFAAGRSSFLDGGMMVYGLDAKTGRVLHTHLLEGPWPDINKDTGTPFAMEGALPDLIVSDGKDLYMQRIKFDAQLNRLETLQESPLGELDMGANHLVATGGFLDDTGFDRLYWMYGRRWPGFYFAQQSPKAGQLVVFDESTTYAVKYFYRRFQWSPLFIPAEHGYLLFADDNDNEPILEEKGQPARAINWLPKETLSDKHRRGGRGVEKGTGYVRQRPEKWQKMIPLRIRAMVLAGDCLFAAGIPDILDPKDPLAAFEGRKGALLEIFSTRDGSRLKSYPLPSMPAFDGMSAAGGRLYLATRDGKVCCFGDADKG